MHVANLKASSCEMPLLSKCHILGRYIFTNIAVAEQLQERRYRENAKQEK